MCKRKKSMFLSVWSHQSKGNCFACVEQCLYIVIQRVKVGRQKWQRHMVTEDVFENLYNLSVYTAFGWRYCISNCFLLLNFRTLLEDNGACFVGCGPSVLLSLVTNRREDQGFRLFRCPAVEFTHEACQLSDQQTLLIKQWTFGVGTWLWV